MKVIFFSSPPFFLTHGGLQTLTEALMRELVERGVQVDTEKWWDERQRGDIIHHVGRPPLMTVRAAHRNGYKVVMTENLAETASRSRARLLAQRAVTDLARKCVPGGFLDRMGWDVYRELDAMVFVVEHEWEVAKYLFHANPDRGHIVPHGLDPAAIGALARPQEAGDYLVCMATIYPVKNNLLLAQAAKLAGTPVVFLGKPYSESDPYFLEFKKLADGKVVRYAGFASGEEKYRWLRGAKGFVLLSQYESGCIAVYEAAAAGLPLLLTDLPWANRVYCGIPGVSFSGLGSPDRIAPILRRFYDEAQRQSKQTFPVPTWREVAERYSEIYRKILNRS